MVEKQEKKSFLNSGKFWLVVSFLYLLAALLYVGKDYLPYNQVAKSEVSTSTVATLDKFDYIRRVVSLANMQNVTPTSTVQTSTSTKIYQTSWGKFKMTKPLWPAKISFPNYGALLPFNRIIAYYGNFYSKGMGILGEYPEKEVLAKLKVETDKWALADSDTPVITAIHYIAVTAQGSKGYDGKYRARMPDSQIEKAIAMAEKINGIVFLDIQVALSNLENEIPLLEKYLKMPKVHLAIDPEFSMKDGSRPGKKIGTMDAKDINYAIDYLQKLVVENNLPPKILIVHRFTEDMVTNYKNIEIVPEVQVVINMDGWGIPVKKLGTYQYTIFQEPVQFTGFKLFYKNDTKTGTLLMTPEDLLKVTPKPIYIQYQ